jgi:hypothetical protein
MDEFGMAGSGMTGFRDAVCPVKTGNPEVIATVYHKRGTALPALASWSTQDAAILLAIDWKALGIDPARATLTALRMEDLQSGSDKKPTGEIKIPSGTGQILMLNGSHAMLDPQPMKSP